ncbi:MAG: response regulator transcription factor [Campylobacterota bacterium]|nr:response regulator transcription factor [Campylobacterota bacterium]
MTTNQPYSSLSILIVEDMESVRNDLQEILTHYFGFVHSAKDGCEGLSAIEKYHPDIIISDIDMPCLNGLEMISEAKKINSHTIIICTTAFKDTDYMLDAIDLKIDGYLIKPVKVDELLVKIEDNLKHRVVEKDGETTLLSSAQLHRELSQREYEIFMDLAKGIKPQHIAEKYGIKPKTISTYRIRIFEKMHMHSNAELTRYAVENNLL